MHLDLEELEILGDAEMNNIVSSSAGAAYVMLTVTAIAVLLALVIGTLFARSISKPIVKLAAVSNTLSKGDLTVQLDDEKRKDEIGILTASLGDMIAYWTPTVTQITTIAEQLNASAEEMAASSEEVNAASEEISSVTQQLSTGAARQTEQIGDALTQVENFQEQFNTSIKEIELASELISNIASQVNILALNASIEAARAGDYGRGFAVVADNVRRLANETRQSLVDVNAIIEDLRTTLSSSIDQITTSIESVASISQETAASSEEASAATEEQTATMEELTAAAQELATVAIEMSEITKRFIL